MSAAPALEVRQAIVAALKADAVLTALVPAARIYGERSERSGWPFIRCSEFEGAPRYQVVGNVHTFTRSKFADTAHQGNARVGAALDSAVLTLSDGRRANIEVTATRVLEDPDEKDAWHGICSILATIAADCTEK